MFEFIRVMVILCSAGGDGREICAMPLNVDTSSIRRVVDLPIGVLGNNVRNGHGTKVWEARDVVALDSPLNTMRARSKTFKFHSCVTSGRGDIDGGQDTFARIDLDRLITACLF